MSKESRGGGRGVEKGGTTICRTLFDIFGGYTVSSVHRVLEVLNSFLCGGLHGFFLFDEGGHALLGFPLQLQSLRQGIEGGEVPVFLLSSVLSKKTVIVFVSVYSVSCILFCNQGLGGSSSLGSDFGVLL